jgi:hypothetical protein
MAYASSELLVSYRERISELHSQCVAADKAVRDALANKVELTRQTGETIKAAKGDLGARDFAEATDFLSSDAVRAYLKLVRLHPEPISDLETGLRVVRESMQATGALNFPSGHGPQTLHAPNFFARFSARVIEIAGEWKKLLTRMPLSSWSEDTVEQFLEAFRPLVTIHREVATHLRDRRKL